MVAVFLLVVAVVGLICLIRRISENTYKVSFPNQTFSNSRKERRPP